MTPTDTYLGLRAFVDELARCGLEHAATSPGSRSTPLVLSLVRHGRIRCWSHLDERAGGFFALGAAKASRRPVAVACTSGTAAANYLPAVVEAYEARVPLLVLTTDRPPELRDLGAGQTIDQVKLYGRNAKWYLEVDEAPATPERLRWLRWLACRAWAVAQEGRAGPVHLNFALREPLILDAPLPADETGRPGGAPWVLWTPPIAEAGPALAEELHERPRAVIVAGRQEDARRGAALAELAERLRLPLLADPLSGARRAGAIAHYDAFLREPDPQLAPELVLRTGDLPTSKPLRQWLGSLPARQVAFTSEAVWNDPAAAVHRVVPGELGDGADAPAAPAGWLERWRECDERAGRALAEVLAGDAVTEPGAVARVWARLPAGATLVVASSMPVRDLETLAAGRADAPRVLANRGANGIDGTVSTAFGVAAATGAPVVALTGDLALLHDLGGLLAHRRLALDLKLVVLNNDGGGIFHFLAVSGERDAFEEHVATPHGLDLAHAAALFGLRHERPADLSALEASLAREGSALIELRTDRAANVELHRRMWAAVRAAA